MARYGPLWLPKFLDGEYFTTCEDHGHGGSGNRSRKFFCIACRDGPHCTLCVQQQHCDHAVLQVRRASWAPSIKVDDIERLVDVSHVEPYKINRCDVVFLPSRPQRTFQPGAYHCEICERHLEKGLRFCSISCKRAALHVDATLTLTITPPPPPPPPPRPPNRNSILARVSGRVVQVERIQPSEASMHSVPMLRVRSRKALADNGTVHYPEQHQQQQQQQRQQGEGCICIGTTSNFKDELMASLETQAQTCQIVSRGKHRRKGIPQRSPLF